MSNRAAREFRKMDRRDQVRIAARIDQLAKRPRPDDVTKLAGVEDVYRIRSGDYRILYQIRDEEMLVIVARIAPRGQAYRRLKDL